MQVDPLRGIEDLVSNNLCASSDSWGRHENRRSLMPVVDILSLPDLFIHAGGTLRIFLREAAQMDDPALGVQTLQGGQRGPLVAQGSVRGVLQHDQVVLVGKLDQGLGSGEELHKTLVNIAAISTELKTELGPLLQKTKRALDGVSDLASTLGPEEKKKLQRSLDELLALSSKVSAVASDAQSLLSDVKRGKGTAGALLTDPQIYDDLKELTRDLKRNPWKFFWKE